jgi:hypothetical protein
MIIGRVTNIRQETPITGRITTTVTLVVINDSSEELQESMKQEMILISRAKYDKLMHHVTAEMILEE